MKRINPHVSKSVNFSDSQENKPEVKSEETPVTSTETKPEEVKPASEDAPDLRARLLKAMVTEFGEDCVHLDEENGKISVTCGSDHIEFSDDESFEDENQVQEDEINLESVPESVKTMTDEELTNGVSEATGDLENLSDEIESKAEAGEDTTDLEDQYEDKVSELNNFSVVLRSRGYQVNFSIEDECETCTASQGQIPVVIDDIPHVSVDKLEVGDRLVTPFGDDAVVIEDPQLDSTEIKVAIPSEGTVIDVPVSELRNFCVRASVRNLVNFSENKEDSAPVTVKESEAISKSAIDEKKDEIANQAANQVIEAVSGGQNQQPQSAEAPTEQPQEAPAPAPTEAPAKEGKVEEGKPQESETPTPETVNEPEATPAPEGKVEGSEDETEGTQVNHSNLLTPKGNQTNFSSSQKTSGGSYVANLMRMNKLGKM